MMMISGVEIEAQDLLGLQGFCAPFFLYLSDIMEKEMRDEKAYIY